MRCKKSDMYNVEENKPAYGILVWAGEWLLAGDSSGPFIYDTKAERDITFKKVKELPEYRGK